MKKFLLNKTELKTKYGGKILVLGLILVVMVGLFSPLTQVNAQNGEAAIKNILAGAATNPNLTPQQQASASSTLSQMQNPGDSGSGWFSIVWNFIGWIGARIAYFTILKTTAWIVWFSGILLDFVLKWTVVDMQKNIGAMTGINIAWKVIRDIMNIAFIFLLVYEAILMIIGQSSVDKVKKFITAVVLASLFINFSLFFTKVMIDASNIVTTGIYSSIIAGSTQEFQVDSRNLGQGGLSVPFMNAIGASGFYSKQDFSDIATEVGGNGNMMIFFIIGSLVLLIMAFVFFAVTCMFVIRYITLIVLLMLSPVAYMGSALPFMDTYSKQWWDSLKGQLLFAPVYMIMTSVVLTLMTAQGFLINKGVSMANLVNGGDTNGGLGLILNFVVIIGLAIASLVIAKSTSTQGSKLIGQATSKFTAFAGGAVMGSAAWAVRKPVGWSGNQAADSVTLQEKASKENKNIFSRTLARTALYGARTTRDATFDIRNASVPGMPNTTPIGAYMADVTGVGKGGTKGYKEEKEASDKKKRDREASNSNELALAQAKKAVLEGAKPEATPAQIDAMEKALAKLSVKQTETLVASNRELLDSQNFANKISVQQLEAINKSDQFSETEKGNLKGRRFEEIKTIHDPVALAAHAAASLIPAAARTANQVADIKRVDDARRRVQGLSDSELEMIDPNYFDASRPEAQAFIAQLKPNQAETINKSNKFTTSQKAAIRNERKKPLINALTTPATATTPAVVGNPIVIKDMLTKKLSPKDVAGLMSTTATFVDHTGTTVTTSILTHPDILEQFTPSLLKRIAPELSAVDIQTIHDVIEDFGTTPGASANMTRLAAWLGSPDGAIFS